MKFQALFSSFFLCIVLVQAATVTVANRKILVDGSEYKIHGICYSRGGAGTYAQDIPLLREAHINTIRVYWYVEDRAELDAFAAAGIKIIMHLDENNFETYINNYKDHPAILMWEFGNEFNYHPEWFNGSVTNWYTKLEACAQRAHQLDPSRPVTTAHGELPASDVLAACPSVDVWGMNLYRWDNDVPAITDLDGRLSASKALYVSECGGDGYNKTQNKINEAEQATADRTILTGIVGRYDICAGVTLFEFCDEWWKAGDDAVQNPGGSAPNSSGVPYDGSPDEEYWGIVNRDRSKKAAFAEVAAVYAPFDNVVTVRGDGLPGLVTLFPDVNYGGRAVGVSTGGYSLSALYDKGYDDNAASSVKVLEGYTAELFVDDGFGGSSVVIDADNGWLGNVSFNDMATSLRVGTVGDESLEGTWFLKNRNSGLYLDISGADVADGAAVIQSGFNGNDNQKFRFVHKGGGVYEIRPLHSDKSLDIKEVSKDDGALVQQWTAYAAENQLFILVPADAGSFKLVAKHSGKIVEVGNAYTNAGATVNQYANNNQSCGEWFLEDMTTGIRHSGLMKRGVVRISQSGTRLFVDNIGAGARAALYDLRGMRLVELSEGGIDVKGISAGMHLVRIERNGQVETIRSMIK